LFWEDVVTIACRVVGELLDVVILSVVFALFNIVQSSYTNLNYSSRV
jgi:hypothetical protein